MKNSAIGSNWKDVRAELFTKEEILESDLRVAIMTELIEARHEKGISQKKLEELSGVSQPVIARMETGKTSPQLDTVLKVLASLGKTLAVVPLEQEKKGLKEIRKNYYGNNTNLPVALPSPVELSGCAPL